MFFCGTRLITAAPSACVITPRYHGYSLLQSVALLEAQRVKAVQDVETLMQARRDALADPIAFVNRLQAKQDMGQYVYFYEINRCIIVCT